MEIFKIELFEKENPSNEFPSFITLDSEGTAKIRQRFAQKLKTTENLGGKELLALLSSNCETIKKFNATVVGFNVSEVLSDLKVFPKDKIYINWYRYDDIDEMSFTDFSKYFDYIWFPSSDDIDLFDDTYDWVLSISHEGYVSYRKL